VSYKVAIVEAAETAPAIFPAKKSKSTAPKEKNTAVGRAHPPVSEMVTVAIETLEELGESSLQAIKKYLATNYKVDCDKLIPFIIFFFFFCKKILQMVNYYKFKAYQLPAPSKKEVCCNILPLGESIEYRVLKCAN
jgi:hypothetical protein